MTHANNKTLRTALVALVLLLTLPVAAVALAQSQTAVTKAGQSSIVAVGSKVTGDHTLTFNNFEGTATFSGNTVTGLEFTIDMGDFQSEIENKTFNDKLVSHLKSADFFDVANHPKGTFKSTSIEAKKSKFGTHMVQGDMTLRGKTVTIRFPATIAIDKDKASGQAEFTINRQNFGMAYPGRKDDLIRDEVLLKLNLNFKR